MSGSDRLARSLAAVGVKHVFGLPGTQNADLFNVLPEYGVRSILATHEASAAFMANGYARASGRPGVVAAINGPGFAFALPGLAEARLDSVPLLLVTGAPPTDERRRFLHQAIDQRRIADPLAKAVIDVAGSEAIDTSVRHAHRLATEGEPGPVVLQVSVGALRGGGNAGTGETARGPSADRRDATDARSEAATAGDPGRDGGEGEAGVEGWGGELRALVLAARRPLLLLGMGAAPSAPAIGRLLGAWPAPVVTTLSGRGVVPEDDPLCLAFDADRGTVRDLNELIASADLVLALGCKLSHNGTAGFQLHLPEDRLVHVNVDPDALGANYPARLAIQADAGAVVSLLADEVVARSEIDLDWSEGELSEWKARIGTPSLPALPEPSFGGFDPPDPATFFGALRAALPRETILVTDSGLHQVMTRRYYEVLAPGGLVTPADFQSMGFGIPAAIGAALSGAARPVVALVGDGGFLMTAMDLVCATRESVPLPVIVFNDGQLNLIRLQQLRDYGRADAVGLETPDLAVLAEAIGVPHEHLAMDVEGQIRRALEGSRPTLLEVTLGDSRAIRRVRVGGAARRLVRRSLSEAMLDRVKRLIGRG